MRHFAHVLVLAVLAISTVLLPTAAAAAPSNDDIAGAITIPGFPFTDQVNTSEATVAADDPTTDCFGPLATVWFEFTPDQTMQVEITTVRSDYNTTLAVFSGRPGALTHETCNDDDVNAAPSSRVVFTATAGTQYFVMAGTCCGGDPGQVGPGGNLVLNAIASAIPRNDDIGGAVTIPGPPFTDQVNTSEATVAADDPTTDCFGPLATVWYAFTPAETLHARIDTVGSDYDTTLAVFSGSPESLTLETCNDDGVNLAPASRVVFTAMAGTQYFVMAGTCCGGDPGQVGPGGNLVLNVAEATQPPVSVAVDVEMGRVTDYGSAIITGTVSCNNAASLSLSVGLTQRFARFEAQGATRLETTCGLTPSAWSVEVHSTTGVVFGPGRADVGVQARACDEFACTMVEAAEEVRLRRQRK